MEIIDVLKKANILCEVKGKPREALRFLRKIEPSVSDPYLKILLETQMAHYALDVGETRASKRHFETALAATQFAHADIARKYAYLLWKFGDRQRAIRVLRRAERELYTANGGSAAHIVLANIYATWGNFWFDKRRYTQAMAAYKRALREAKTVKYYGRVSTILGDMGSVYWAEDQHKKALATLKQALRLARKYHLHAEPSALFRMGRMKMSIGAHRQAKKYFSEALNVAKRGKWKREIGDAENALGELALAKGDAKSARRHFWNALKIYRGLGFRPLIRITEKNWTRTAKAR